MIKYERVKNCRVCGNKNLLEVIDLSDQYLSSVFPDNLDYKNKYQPLPLKLLLCEKTDYTCGLLQLAGNYDLNEMYKQYPYQSSTNAAM
ncbi:MAG: methyltransferase, partial [Nanoarchaeota archaeon]